MWHQRVHKIGLEHLGVVVGDGFDAFSREHRSSLTGQQFQSLVQGPPCRRVPSIWPTSPSRRAGR